MAPLGPRLPQPPVMIAFEVEAYRPVAASISSLRFRSSQFHVSTFE